jgi:hypothetical protein
MDLTVFGCYKAFYRDTSYIRLLHLGGVIDKVNKSVIELSELPSQQSWTEDTLRLLASDDWRYHIVPLISYLTLKERSMAIEQELWSCIVRGSWVSPQIVAGLHFKGADVVVNTVEILRNGIYSRITDPFIAHIEMGPGSNASRQGKLLNSIIGLGLRNELMMPDIEIDKIISLDIDDAYGIAAMWYRNIIRTFNDTQCIGKLDCE